MRRKNFSDLEKINFEGMIKIDDNSRFVYPCFFYSQCVFNHVKDLNFNVIVKYNHVKNGEMIFYTTINSKSFFIKKSNMPVKNNKVCLVVHCYRSSASLSSLNLLDKLNVFGLYNVLLMNMAAHPQFSGEKLSVFADQLFPHNYALTPLEDKINNDFSNFKKNARIYRLCKENPELLLVEHMFFDTIENQITLSYNETVYEREAETT